MFEHNVCEVCTRDSIDGPTIQQMLMIGLQARFFWVRILSFFAINSAIALTVFAGQSSSIKIITAGFVFSINVLFVLRYLPYNSW